ncbi:MAG: helix-turn-helix domain-containing protein [Flavobacteriaceae bacterium]|nr:helix-turn-helix domain-containing protein [Flavobacteriaceae bacterium]
MGKLLLNTLELSDIKKIVEEALENKLKGFLEPQPENKLELLTRKDTAKLLRISLPTLHDWTKNGVIKAHRIGNRVLYKHNEVTEALNLIQTSTKRGGYHG